MNKQDYMNRKNVLEQELAKIDVAGAEYPSIFPSREHAVQEYRTQIAAADQRIKAAEMEEEKEAKRQAEANVADEKKRVLLRAIIAELPASWKAEVAEDKYDGPWIKAIGCQLTLKNIYSGSSRFIYGTPSGTKLVASTNYESRGFPRKKDGSFSIDKAVAFILEQQEIRAAKDTREGQEVARLARFQALIRPYSKYNVYRTEERFRVSNTFEIFVKRTSGEADQYMVQRTTTESVTPEQLAQILANEVPVAKQLSQQEG